MHIWAQVAFGILAYPPPPDCSKKFIFALTVTGARWSNQITAHPITGLSVNGNVGHQLDLVLDLGDYVIIHLVYEGLSVNDNVGRFLDHVLDQGDHVIINLIHEGNIVNGYVTITLDHVLDQGVHVFIHFVHKVSVSMVVLHSP